MRRTKDGLREGRGRRVREGRERWGRNRTWGGEEGGERGEESGERRERETKTNPLREGSGQEKKESLGFGCRVKRNIRAGGPGARGREPGSRGKRGEEGVDGEGSTETQRDPADRFKWALRFRACASSRPETSRRLLE